MKLQNAPIISVRTMITIGILHWDMSHNNVLERNCIRWLRWEHESFISANGNILRRISNNFVQLPVLGLTFSGLHQKNKNCNSNEEIARIQFLLQNAKSSKQFYPSQLKITQNIIEDTPLGNSNGGWSDVRDHYLCLNFTKSKTQLKFEHVKFVPRKIKYKMNWASNSN